MPAIEATIIACSYADGISHRRERAMPSTCDAVRAHEPSTPATMTSQWPVTPRRRSTQGRPRDDGAMPRRQPTASAVSRKKRPRVSDVKKRDEGSP